MRIPEHPGSSSILVKNACLSLLIKCIRIKAIENSVISQYGNGFVEGNNND